MALAEKLLLFLLTSHAAWAGIASSAPELEVVSKPYTNVAHVFGDSSGLLLSGDGKWAAFNSTGIGLATNDNNGGALDVFLKNLATGETRLVSRDLTRGSASGDSILTGLSEDGGFVLFESSAPALVATDGNDQSDVFLYDRDSGSIESVSAGAAGTFNGASGASSITRNGRFILFESNADGIVPEDTNTAADLFLFDRQARTVKLVSWNVSNTASGGSQFPATLLGTFNGVASEDGRYVAFMSSATNLTSVPGDGTPQIYLRDTLSGTNLWISRSATKGVGNNLSRPQLSTNGAVVAFLSSSLAPGQQSPQWLHLYLVSSNELREVPAPTPTGPGAMVEEFTLSADGQIVAYVLGGILYTYDLSSGNTTRVWDQIGGVASQPVFSDDAKSMIFQGAIDGPGSNTAFQLFGYDFASGQVRLLTPSLSGTGGIDHDAVYPVLSGDGSTAGFMSYAQDVVPNDDKNENDVFVVATSGAAAPVLVSAPLGTVISATGNGSSEAKQNLLSEDGRFVAFSSLASDLVPNDNNNNTDVFLRDLQSGTTRLVSISPDGLHPYAGSSTVLDMSRDGRFVAFNVNPLTAATPNIYVYDGLTGSNSVASILPNGSAGASREGFLSADGQYLAFRVTSGNVGTIYLRELANGVTHTITNFSQTFWGISPSGRYVVLSQGGPLGGVFLVDWRTTNTVSFPSLSNFLAPQLSDDETKVLYYGNSLGRSGYLLYLASLGQGRSSNLIATNVTIAALSGDGSTIVAVEQPGDSPTLVFHDVASGDTTTVSIPQSAGTLNVRGTPVLSRDGRYVAFASTNALAGGTVPASTMFSFTTGFSESFRS